jgi:hypothetical protein
MAAIIEWFSYFSDGSNWLQKKNQDSASHTGKNRIEHSGGKWAFLLLNFCFLK